MFEDWPEAKQRMVLNQCLRNDQTCQKDASIPADHDNDGCFVFHGSISDGSFFTYTRHEPVGVCGQIIPVSISRGPPKQANNEQVTKSTNQTNKQKSNLKLIPPPHPFSPEQQQQQNTHTKNKHNEPTHRQGKSNNGKNLANAHYPHTRMEKGK